MLAAAAHTKPTTTERLHGSCARMTHKVAVFHILNKGEGLEVCRQTTLKQEMNKLRYSLSRHAVAESEAAEKVPSTGLKFFS